MTKEGLIPKPEKTKGLAQEALLFPSTLDLRHSFVIGCFLIRHS
ncbi:MAG: hypothetical protein RL015_1227 [Verrucomicrobiota bacterium]